MPNPTTFASPRQFIGVAVETVQGTAVVPVATIPVDKCDPQDKWVWLDDKALRGSMTEPYVRVQGPGHSEFAFNGPCYFDNLPYLLSNIMGDVVYSGTYTGSGTTTSTASTAVGAVAINVHASTGTVLVQIDTGNLAEVRTITSVTGSSDPFTLNFAGGLSYAHASGVAVKPITSPYTDQFAVLNTGTAQPSSMTITDWQGPTATVSARAYPGACLSDLTIKGAAASTLVEYDAKGQGWLSAAAASTPTPILSGKFPQAAFTPTIGLNGTVGGAQVKTILDYEINLKRDLEVIWTAQNNTNPYFIQRGKLTATGKITVVASDETSLTYLNSNTQPQMQIIATNGLSGANLLSMQIDILNAAYTTSVISRGKAAVEYAIEFQTIANTTNAGGSGGYNPILFTIQNAVAPLSF